MACAAPKVVDDLEWLREYVSDTEWRANQGSECECCGHKSIRRLINLSKARLSARSIPQCDICLRPAH